MMRSWLTRYHWCYPRSLVYMLQASEYNLLDYLQWYRRTHDFTMIEKRNSLVKNAKATLLLITVWFILLFLYFWAIFLLVSWQSFLGITLFLLIIFLAPFFLGYLIIVPLWLANLLVQKPLEYIIVTRATQKLSAHSGFKIAIVGSYGKTSMREILKTILSEGKKVAAPPHSYNTPLSISRFTMKLKGDEEVLIFELGEYYPGDIRKLCRLTQPDLGIIMGVNEAHLSKFKDLKKTADTIFELADWLKQKPVYINEENKLVRERVLPRHFTFNRSGLSDLKISNAKTELAGTFFDISIKKQKLSVKSKLLGLHQLGPLAAAAHIALRLGMTLDQIKKGIAQTKPFAHRLEPHLDSTGVITLDDSYNGNPDGVRAVINFLSSLKNHRRFYVTPGLVEMGSNTRKVHRDIGKSLAKAGIEKVVLVRNSVTPYIAKGLQEAKYQGETLWFDSGPSAFKALSQLTVKGDVVLLQNDWPDQYQ